MGDRGSGPHPLKNHKFIGLFCNTGPDPLKKLPSQVFSVGPSSAISMAFRWRADDGTIKRCLDPLSPIN